MNATTVAIDLAKDVFELAFAEAKGASPNANGCAAPASRRSSRAGCR